MSNEEYEEYGVTITSREELKKALEECYTYSFKRAEHSNRNISDTNETYKCGKMDGMVEAYGVIYLACFGEKEMTELWLKNLNAMSAEEGE